MRLSVATSPDLKDHGHLVVPVLHAVDGVTQLDRVHLVVDLVSNHVGLALLRDIRLLNVNVLGALCFILDDLLSTLADLYLVP
jgi:hypothetical protein